MSGRPNHSIRCNVENCKNHCGSDCFCGLDTVEIGGSHSAGCRSYVSGGISAEQQLELEKQPPVPPVFGARTDMNSGVFPPDYQSDIFNL